MRFPKTILSGYRQFIAGVLKFNTVLGLFIYKNRDMKYSFCSNR